MADSRRAVAEKLFDICVKYDGVFRDVESLKDQLREFAIADGHGFTEDFGDARFIKVSSPSDSKFKGIVPVLDPAAFLALAKRRQEALIAEKVITMEQQFTKASRPSVSVQT